MNIQVWRVISVQSDSTSDSRPTSRPLLSTVVSRSARLSTTVNKSSRTRKETDGSRDVSYSHDSVIIGKGHSSSLKVAQRDRNNNRPADDSARVNRQCTGLFVSRLSPRTTINNIQQHVRRETGLSIRAEKLDTRFGSYSSFFIRGDRRLRDQLMSAHIWPEGTFIKLFCN